MPSCKYTGTWSDYSGYGQANRNFIAALHTAGVEVSTELVVQVPERGYFGWVGELCKALRDRTLDYKIKIIHLTPDMYSRYMESGKYHIGHLFWETDRLPKDWPAFCNKLNEIWTASEEQAEMIRRSGVTIPVYAFPQPIDIVPAKQNTPPYIVPSFSGFVFYSIFQWIERKNPKALVTNFWRAFTGKGDVALVLKTYRTNYSDSEFNAIRDTVNGWKKELALAHYPRIFLCKKLLDTSEMFRLHKTGNCYVATTRGEGWCIPAVEAMLTGNPVIGIDKTGFADYLTNENYYPCKTYDSKVTEVPSIPYYTADQKWLEISDKELVENMLDVYNNRDKARAMGKKAQEFVSENFNYWVVGGAMKQRLETIEKIL